jgi:hypothetical protein
MDIKVPMNMTCFLDAKQIGCSQMLQRICRKTLNQTDKRISYLICDNAKEFLSSESKEYFSIKGAVLRIVLKT